MRRWAGTLVLVCTLLTGASAVAQPGRRAAVIRLEVDGRVTEGGRIQLQNQLAVGLASAMLQAIQGDNVRAAVKRASGGDSCKTETCLRDVAAALGVDYLVAVSVTAKQRNYGISVKLFAANGQQLGESTDSCELCGIQDVGDKLRRVAASMSLYVPVAAVNVASTLMFESTPSGADVTVDGVPRGQTPITVDLPPGEHQVAIATPGHRPVNRKITSDAGRAQLISIDLPPASTAVSRSSWNTLGWTAVAVGVASLAGGAVAMAMDKKEIACASNDTAQKCVRRTNFVGGILLGAGAASALAGGVVLYVSARPAAEPGATVAAAPFDWTVGVSGRF